MKIQQPARLQQTCNILCYCPYMFFDCYAVDKYIALIYRTVPRFDVLTHGCFAVIPFVGTSSGLLILNVARTTNSLLNGHS